MKVLLHASDDLAELRLQIGIEHSALQRDRLRVVLLGIEGIEGRELMREEIAQTVGRSRQFVDEWVKRYRLHGLPGLNRLKAKGNPPSLTSACHWALKTGHLRALPKPATHEGVCCRRFTSHSTGDLRWRINCEWPRFIPF